jgi:hypothetical protein
MADRRGSARRGSTTTARVPPADRDDETAAGNFGNDQWWPWADIGRGGTLAVGFNDRRLDQDSVAHEWPTSRQRPGNYLVGNGDGGVGPLDPFLVTPCPGDAVGPRQG